MPSRPFDGSSRLGGRVRWAGEVDVRDFAAPARSRPAGSLGNSHPHLERLHQTELKDHAHVPRPQLARSVPPLARPSALRVPPALHWRRRTSELLPALALPPAPAGAHVLARLTAAWRRRRPLPATLIGAPRRARARALVPVPVVRPLLAALVVAVLPPRAPLALASLGRCRLGPVRPVVVMVVPALGAGRRVALLALAAGRGRPFAREPALGLELVLDLLLDELLGVALAVAAHEQGGAGRLSARAASSPGADEEEGRDARLALGLLSLLPLLGKPLQLALLIRQPDGRLKATGTCAGRPKRQWRARADNPGKREGPGVRTARRRARPPRPP